MIVNFDIFYFIIGMLILQYNLLWIFIEHSFCGGQPKGRIKYHQIQNGSKHFL